MDGSTAQLRGDVRWQRECANLIDAAAATGALERILRARHHNDRIDVLRSIEPQTFDRMQAKRAIEWMVSGAPIPDRDVSPSEGPKVTPPIRRVAFASHYAVCRHCERYKPMPPGEEGRRVRCTLCTRRGEIVEAVPDGYHHVTGDPSPERPAF